MQGFGFTFLFWILMKPCRIRVVASWSSWSSCPLCSSCQKTAGRTGRTGYVNTKDAKIVKITKKRICRFSTRTVSYIFLHGRAIVSGGGMKGLKTDRRKRNDFAPAGYFTVCLVWRPWLCGYSRIGMPIRGHSTYTAKPMTTIRIILAGMPYRKNSPVVNCLES